MAFSLSSIFGGAPVAAPAPTTPTAPVSGDGQPGNIPPQSGVTDPTNPTVPPQGTPVDPNNQKQTGNIQAPTDPLASFADLWKPPVDAGGKPVADPNSGSVFPNVDPKKIMDIAGKANFAAAIPKESLAKIAAGGQDAVEAFAQAMNSVSQTVFAQAAMAATKIAEQAVTKSQERMNAQMPEIIKRHTLSDNLRGENPLFSNPAVQPIITAMESQLAKKFPNATSTELTTMAKQYVAGLGNVFSPAPANTNNNSSKPNETDWSSFLS